MSGLEPPSGPPAEAGTPEPGHRARALAASLLGELTGQRRSGLTFAPLEPTGLAREPLGSGLAEAARAAEQSVEQQSVEQQAGEEQSRDEQAGDEQAGVEQAGADQAAAGLPAAPAEVSPADEASPVPTAPQDAAVETDPEAVTVQTVEDVRAVPVVADGEPTDQVQDGPGPSSPATPRPAQDPTRPGGAPRPLEQQTGPLRAVPAPLAATGPALRAVPDASAAPAPAAATPPAAAAATLAPAAERPTVSVPTVSAPAATAGLVPQAPSPSAPVPARGPDAGSGGAQEVRPAPFAYLSVAQHHTNPARATANGALDQAGQRISSRVDRGLVRRAALVAMEASSLLDACDVLDGRARAADVTWTGEHHSATEVREFEGAWGAFYDAQGALASHVTG